VTAAYSADLVAPDELAAIVGRAGQANGAARALLLDVDGTLAPIAATPEQAVVPAPTLDALRRLSTGGWTIAPVSGRPLAQIVRMIPIEGILPFGSHGLESLGDGGETRLAAEPGSGERLERLKESAKRAARGAEGVRLELKPGGVAFHDRGLDAGALRDWHRTLTEWLDRRSTEGFDVLQGKRVVEIRLAGGDKGLAVREVAARRGLSREDASFVAVGDDVTDEDMFRAIRGLGVGVRVGEDDEPTEATRRLRSPAEVRRFLTGLAESVLEG
jgi:trehalose-phosphatase